MKTAFPVAFSASLFLVPVLGYTNDAVDEMLTESSASTHTTAFADVPCDRHEACDCSSGLRRFSDELAASNECNVLSPCADAAS